MSGLASVQKNGPKPDRYPDKEAKNGKHRSMLKVANHQVIGKPAVGFRKKYYERGMTGCGHPHSFRSQVHIIKSGLRREARKCRMQCLPHDLSSNYSFCGFCSWTAMNLDARDELKIFKKQYFVIVI